MRRAARGDARDAGVHLGSGPAWHILHGACRSKAGGSPPPTVVYDLRKKMRYPKGGIDLTSSQDTLLLQQVLRSRHVSHEQLWEFMQHRAREHRVGLGKAAALLVTGGFVELDHGPIQHSLELNDLHLALLRAGVLTSWQAELGIRSLNEFTAYG